MSRGMPMPVSADREAQQHLVVGLRHERSSGPRPRPAWVNLTALPARLSRIWRSRPGSPTQLARHVGIGGADELEPRLLRPDGQHRGEVVEQSRAGRSRCVSSSSLPASILEKSRMSLMSASSESARRPNGLGVAALLVVERRVEQQARHADDAVHRRADLVAHVGQELALGLVRARRRRPPARSPGSSRSRAGSCCPASPSRLPSGPSRPSSCRHVMRKTASRPRWTTAIARR